jgi:hypothetical protein
VWGSQQWQRVGGTRTACPECRQVSAVDRSLAAVG